MIETYLTAMSVCTVLVSVWMLVMACHRSCGGKSLNIDGCGDGHGCARQCAMSSLTSCDNRFGDNEGTPVPNIENHKEQSENKCPVPFPAKRPEGCFAEKVPDTFFPLIAKGN